MGKASLALDITRHVADELHKPVGVFSLEMRADELGLKLLSAESDIAARCSRAGQLSSQHWRDSTPPSGASLAPASISTTPPAWCSAIWRPTPGGSDAR